MRPFFFSLAFLVNESYKALKVLEISDLIGFFSSALIYTLSY
jgi:hypothetical protein